MSDYWVWWPISGMVMHLYKCLDDGLFEDGFMWAFLAQMLFFNAAIIGPFYFLILCYAPKSIK